MANKIMVELDLDTLAAQGKLKGFTKKAKDEGGKASQSFGQKFKKDLDKKMDNLAKAFTPLNVGIAATAASFAILAKNAAVAVGEMRIFGRAVANVNSILPKNQKLTEESTNALNDFAASFGTSNARQADAFYSIVSAGVKGTAKQLKTLQVANEAAVAGLVDIDTSAKVLVSSVNSYAKSGLTAEQASDALFVAVREGQTTFGELSDSLGNVAPVAAAAGLKFEELAGAIAGITKAGIKTDIAVTGVRALLSSLIKVTPQAAQEAKRLGLEFSTAALKSKGFTGFLKDVADKTKGSEVALGKLFPNVRALTPILQVVNGDFDDFVRIQKEVQNSMGATAKAADIIRNSLDFKLKQADANFSILRQELVSSFIPALGDAASAISRYLTLQRDTASETSKLQAKIGNMRGELEEWTKVMNSQGVPALKDYSTNATLAQQKVFLLTDEMRKMRAQVVAIRNQELLDESTFGKLTTAKAELFSLNERLAHVGQGFVDLQGKSQIELLGDVTAKTAEIAALNAELIKTTTIAPEEDEALPMEKSIYSLATNGMNLLSSLKLSFSDLSDGSKESMKKIESTAKSLGNTFKQGVTRVISGGIQNIISSIGKGENAFGNFGKFMLQTIGGVAIKMGETMILAGLAIESLKGLEGAQAVAAGAALVAIGSILSNAGGGGDTSVSSGGSTGGGGSFSESETFAESENVEERTTSTVVNLNVQGVVAGDKTEVASFVQGVLNEANEKNGIIQLNTRTA